MQKNTFSFGLFLAFSLVISSAGLLQVNAQESDFLVGDVVDVEDDKSSEYLVPDSPFTDENERSKKEKGEVKKQKKGQKIIKLEQSESSSKLISQPKVDEQPLYNPAESDDARVGEDNPLSFNFLYYIIHKFKFADVIDQ